MILPRPNPRQLEEMMITLAGDSRFQLFVNEVRGMRESAIQDLCNDTVVADHARLAAAVGEIRTYSAILSIADSHIGRLSIQQG